MTRNLINELHEKLRFAGLGIESLWNAYALTQKGRVKPLKNQDSSQNSNVAKLTNLIQIVRFELGFDSELRNFCCVANSRFELWKGRQIKKGIDFSAEQVEFLTHIKDFHLANAYLANDDLQGLNDACGDTNGVFVAKALFGESFAPLLDELNFALLSGISDLKAG